MLPMNIRTFCFCELLTLAVCCVYFLHIVIFMDIHFYGNTLLAQLLLLFMLLLLIKISTLFQLENDFGITTCCFMMLFWLSSLGTLCI